MHIPIAVEAEQTRLRQRRAMGSQRRTAPGRLQVEADGELTHRFGPPGVNATVDAEPQQPQRADPDRHHAAAKMAPIELEQLQRHRQAPDHRLHLLQARPALLSPGNRSRDARRRRSRWRHQHAPCIVFVRFLSKVKGIIRSK